MGKRHEVKKKTKKAEKEQYRNDEGKILGRN